MVWYEDSNHCRIGGGDSSIGGAACAAVNERDTATAMPTPTRQERSRHRRAADENTNPILLVAQNIIGSIEACHGSADPVIRRQVPVTENLPIGPSFELHIGFEESCK